MNYEELLMKYEDVFVEELDLSAVPGLKGLYLDGMIAIDSRLSTDAEKSCILAEELGHHFTSSGMILDQTQIVNRKQEQRARLWAYDCLTGLDDILAAAQRGCSNLYETAVFLGVTENFLTDALCTWRRKYGIGVMHRSYWIQFIPNLCIYAYRPI